MDPCGAAIAERRQRVAFQNVERADEHNSAGGGQRRADDREVVKGSDDGFALHHVVLGEIVEREQRAVFAQIIDELAGHGSVVEIVGIGGDAFERGGKQGLSEDFAGFVQAPIALKNVA